MALTKLEFQLLAQSFFEREFEVRETLSLLTANKNWWWSWGSNNPRNYNNKALAVNVSGNHHKGQILVTLAWDDTYTLRLINTTGKVKNTITNIYFDELAERIDKEIERIEIYTI
jgi:hypothetical protein